MPILVVVTTACSDRTGRCHVHSYQEGKRDEFDKGIVIRFLVPEPRAAGVRTTYAASLDQTWEAAQGALKDLNYRIISTRKDDPEGEIEAKRIGDETVKIHVMISGPGTTLVKIRVGMFGNEEESRAINSKIASRLGVTL